MVSKINKNIEDLILYNDYKEFLEKIKKQDASGEAMEENESPRRLPSIKTPKTDLEMKEIVESLESDITIPAKLKNIITSAD